MVGKVSLERGTLVMLIETPRGDHWADRALCSQSDPEAWFPEHTKLDIKPMMICHTCPVIRECAKHALTTQPEYGIWAGLPMRVLRGYYQQAADADALTLAQTVQRVIGHGRRLLHSEFDARKQFRIRQGERKKQNEMRRKELANA